MMKQIVLALLFAVTASGAAASHTHFSETEIFAALRAGNMTGFSDTDSHVRTIGTITVGKTNYLVVYYRWEQSWAHAVGFPHAARRLVFLTTNEGKLTYLGFYYEPGKPKSIRGNKVFFSYPASWGNTLVIDENGPPAKPYLAGRRISFEK
jgi:hypothetical protein